MVTNLNKDIVLFNGNEMGNNSYLIVNDDNCVVIDPSWYVDEIDQYVQKHNLKLVGIVLTHAHYDHVGECDFLLNKYNTSLYVYSKEREVLETHHMASWFKKEGFKAPQNIKYFDELNLSINNIELKIIPTPGHTCGGICIQYKDYLFTGDTIFSDGVGRMDLPTGNARQLLMSLQLIKKMDKNLLILPGHRKNAITLEEVTKTNQYLRH